MVVACSIISQIIDLLPNQLLADLLLMIINLHYLCYPNLIYSTHILTLCMEILQS